MCVCVCVCVCVFETELIERCVKRLLVLLLSGSLLSNIN